MQTSGVSLMLDLFDCKSPALANEGILEQHFVDALQFAGFDTVDHLSHHFPNQGTTFVYILKQSHATLHTWPENGFVSVDVYSCGKPEAVRPAPEIIRGYLTQKLIARSVKAQVIERWS
jgi:S-adenosylmethionine decarboxylase